MALLARRPMLINAPALVEMPAIAHDFSCHGQLSPAAVATAPDSLYYPLQTPLTQELEARSSQRISCIRSDTEKAVLDAFMASADTEFWLKRPAEFRRSLGWLNRALTSNGSAWRAGLVGLSPDKSGLAIVFPLPAAVPKQLELLRSVLSDEKKCSALVRATVASTLLLNAHPFTDGNGRLSRLLFNYVLRQAGLPLSAYIPLYEIARRSNGGYEIALRRAEIFSQWSPLIGYYGHVLDICRQLKENGAQDSPVITIPG